MRPLRKLLNALSFIGIASCFTAPRASPYDSSVIVVTGANRGLGLAVVKHIVASSPKKATVVLCSRNSPATRSVVDEIGHAGIRFLFEDLDLSSQESIESCAARIKDAVGFPSTLANIAAVCCPSFGAEQSRAALTEALHVNFFGPVRFAEQLGFLSESVGTICTEEASRFERCVVNVSSGDGELKCLHSRLSSYLSGCSLPSEVIALATALDRASQFDGIDGGTSVDELVSALTNNNQELAIGSTPAYSASKALLNTWTRTVAETGLLAPGVVANCVCPGDIVGSHMYSGTPGSIVCEGGSNRHTPNAPSSEGDIGRCEFISAVSSNNSQALGCWDVTLSEAASDVCYLIGDTARHSGAVRTSGSFYRFREKIPW